MLGKKAGMLVIYFWNRRRKYGSGVSFIRTGLIPVP
jgi:presenilin-like A22 family membrane protease